MILDLIPNATLCCQCWPGISRYPLRNAMLTLEKATTLLVAEGVQNQAQTPADLIQQVSNEQGNMMHAKEQA